MCPIQYPHPNKTSPLVNQSSLLSPPKDDIIKPAVTPEFSNLQSKNDNFNQKKGKNENLESEKFAGEKISKVYPSIKHDNDNISKKIDNNDDDKFTTIRRPSFNREDFKKSQYENLFSN